MYYLTNQEIIKKWKEGISKNQLALIYKRKYNMDIKIIRLDMKNRHSGSFISNYEALAYIEKVIYNEIMKKKDSRI